MIKGDLQVTKKAAGEDRSVYLGLSADVHRTLRHLAAEYDISVPKLLKHMIAEFIASHQQQQSIPEDSEFVPTTEVSNGEETSP